MPRYDFTSLRLFVDAPLAAGGDIALDRAQRNYLLNVLRQRSGDTILLFNVEVATVNTWGSGDQVPIYDRLYLGGSNNLRGFPFREVGPQDDQGQPIGGNSMARATVEFTCPIIEKARGAIFYDTGFVNSEAWSFGFNHIASDIGVGIRLDLPIGPLRLDYGYPIQRDGYNGGGHFNFNVGYQF